MLAVLVGEEGASRGQVGLAGVLNALSNLTWLRDRIARGCWRLRKLIRSKVCRGEVQA